MLGCMRNILFKDDSTNVGINLKVCASGRNETSMVVALDEFFKTHLFNLGVRGVSGR